MLVLDELSSADLATLLHLKREEERRAHRSPGWVRDHPTPDPVATALVLERAEAYLDLIGKVTEAACEMAEGLSVFGPGGPHFTADEIADALVPAAVKAGLPDEDAIDAVASGLRLAGGEHRG
jgi:hypothetical protein